MGRSSDRRWLLLIHQIPPRPAYLRVKIWRQLQRLGAVAIRNSVYVLPRSDQAREDFQWVLREIRQGGGDGSISEARLVDGLSDRQIISLFRAARDAELAQVAEKARRLVRDFPSSTNPGRARRRRIAAEVARLRRRQGEIAAIDFFGAPGRAAVERLLGTLDGLIREPPGNAPGPKPAVRAADFSARTWVTRRGIHVDRMASAWLIRRFIDRQGRFKFVPPKGYRPRRGEVRFDMFEAEFTHEGDRCTFEILLGRFGLDAGPLKSISEIVHDIDLKDSKFARPETAGLERLVAGISSGSGEDRIRLERGAALFDALFESFRRRPD